MYICALYPGELFVWDKKGQTDIERVVWDIERFFNAHVEQERILSMFDWDSGGWWVVCSKL